MQRQPRMVGSLAVVMLAAIATVVGAVVYMTLVRNASAPASIGTFEKAKSSAEQRQMLEKAARDERQRQAEETVDSRKSSAAPPSK